VKLLFFEALPSVGAQLVAEVIVATTLQQSYIHQGKVRATPISPYSRRCTATALVDETGGH
jgi:hypothetical protein